MLRVVPLFLLLLSACGLPVPPTAALPADSVTGIGDPTRAAIIGSAYAFSVPSSIAGRPDAAARAAAQVEYLATELPTGPRWVMFTPLVGLELANARSELHAALGVAPGATPQAVVDALYAASRALRAGDAAAARRALGAPAFVDGPATLARLAQLPPLPRTVVATSLANRELNRADQEGSFSGQGGGDGGKG